MSSANSSQGVNSSRAKDDREAEDLFFTVEHLNVRSSNSFMRESAKFSNDRSPGSETSDTKFLREKVLRKTPDHRLSRVSPAKRNVCTSHGEKDRRVLLVLASVSITLHNCTRGGSRAHVQRQHFRFARKSGCSARPPPRPVGCTVN